MDVLAAFDKFKFSMSADQACDAASKGVQRALGENVIITSAPLTDGGKGFCSILTHAANGHLEHYKVSGPLGELLEAPIGWIDLESIPKRAGKFFTPKSGKLAIIEMATVAGIEQVPPKQRHPNNCTTRGVGELIQIAVTQNASAILLGIGDSATSDLGLGALEALGLYFTESRRITPAHWAYIQEIRGEIELQVPPIYIACDVDNPLTGVHGAASVYGPQKGLRSEEIEAFDHSSSKIADQLCKFFNKSEVAQEAPGSGAAGGLGFGLNIALDASYLPGFELVTAWLDLSKKIKDADLILTGEGELDLSSLSGKGPYSLLATADACSTRAIMLAGKTNKDAAKIVRQRFRGAGIYAITPEGTPLDEALQKAPEFLSRKVSEVLSKLYP